MGDRVTTDPGVTWSFLPATSPDGRPRTKHGQTTASSFGSTALRLRFRRLTAGVRRQERRMYAFDPKQKYARVCFGET